MPPFKSEPNEDKCFKLESLGWAISYSHTPSQDMQERGHEHKILQACSKQSRDIPSHQF